MQSIPTLKYDNCRFSNNGIHLTSLFSHTLNDFLNNFGPCSFLFASVFFAFGCGLLGGWFLAGWLACWLACLLSLIGKLAGAAGFLACDFQRRVFMSLDIGLQALQYSDRFDGFVDCWDLVSDACFVDFRFADSPQFLPNRIAV